MCLCMQCFKRFMPNYVTMTLNVKKTNCTKCIIRWKSAPIHDYLFSFTLFTTLQRLFLHLVDTLFQIFMIYFTCWHGMIGTLYWRHNDYDGVSNHQHHGCLLNRLSRRRWKKTSEFRVTGHCAGNSPVPMNFPHKGPVTRKMFPFDDVIMSMPTKWTKYESTYVYRCSYNKSVAPFTNMD